ncbi:MAG TPA: DPP IV N-terminal domain-containing protein, partial [Wenzhouxiangella sp.]|nr:DPP IV N-terminal domain-containing protein [Wenzhouxiangella sp.]
MPRSLLVLFALVAPALATGQTELTIERIFASPDLSGPSLRQAQLSPDGERVTFLRGSDENRDQLDLWEYHIGDDETRILLSADSIVGQEAGLSSEEKARRERARISGFSGIVEYRWSSDGRFLLFPLDGDVFLLDVNDESGQVRRITSNEKPEIDPRISPDGRFMAFVRDRNLWVMNLQTLDSKALTSDGDNVIANGLAEFIAQEEMDRSRGFWWSPDSRKIAFLRTDESDVKPTRRFEIEADEITLIEQRYPFTGTPNVTYRLGVIDIESDTTQWISLGESTDIYIPRVKWLPSGEHLSYQRQSRDQQQLELILAPLDGSAPKTLLTETSETWINLHSDLHFIEQLDAFIWSSERDGFRHLYLYGLDGQLIRRLTGG